MSKPLTKLAKDTVKNEIIRLEKIKVAELRKENKQMLEALETAQALISRLLVGSKEQAKIKAAIRAAKGEV